jgi:glutaminyl-tRNA synthetase
MPTLFPASAAAATRPRRSAISAARSACRRPTAPSNWACWNIVREDLNKRAPRVMAVLRPLRVVIDNYPEGQVKRWSGEQSRRRLAGHAQSAVLARALHRAGRFPRRSAEAVFPAVAGPRSAPALRLFHHLHQRGEGRKDRRGGRDPLHLRSRHARRQRARRPQGEVDHSLGVGRARHRCRSALYDNLFTKENPGETFPKARISPPI